MKTLIIDRVTVFKEIIAEVLDNSEIEHVFAKTGEEALNLLKQDKFDCICFSLYMDDMNGLELGQKIRKIKNYKHTPIVLLTSKNSNEILKQAIGAGITDVFSKDKVHELVNFIERFNQVNKPISGKILYIEDQQSQREFVTAIFRAKNLEVDSFDNAEDAWQSFLKNHYHLVVTDIVLEGAISGVLLINKIRRLDGEKGDVPILAITAFDDTSRRISLYHMGITDYVIKPIIEEELIARIRNLISKQKAIEQEILFREHLNSEEVVRRSLKLEALGKLTGGIAHDYNNMLGVITGYTELLKKDLSSQPQLHSYVTQIEKASQNGIKLTRKLLSFTRKDASTTETANINELIKESKNIFEKLLTENIKMTMDFDEKLWNISVDTNDFENALLNLCINAKHAMGDKGALTITTTNEILNVNEAEAIQLPAGDYIHLSIEDTGHGMNEETLAKVFDPFFSTKGEAGTGLGLSQVYGFVQRTNGSIEVESVSNKGTVFNLYFPRNEHTEEIKDTAEKTNTEQSSGDGYSILVVDDDPVLTALTSKILETANYQVTTAQHADEALEMLKQNKFSIVLSDITMPGMDGYELAEKIRTTYPDIKIILLSGYHEKNNLTDSVQKSYDMRLKKPFQSDELIKCVDSLLQQK
ncbi:MAG: response regulator [Sulfuriflexus sp.]|nr:response regulator [Sulfuriflexus sp.]